MAHPALMNAPRPEALDDSLAARARAGDRGALAQLYERYSAALYTLAKRLLGSEADAEDVLHDVFLGLPEALRHYEEHGALAGWLKRLTARASLNRIRASMRRGEEDLADTVPRRAESNALDAIAVRDAVHALPATLRAVLLLKEVEGFSHEEIGGMLGITRGASEVRLHRALRALRVTLGERT